MPRTIAAYPDTSRLRTKGLRAVIDAVWTRRSPTGARAGAARKERRLTDVLLPFSCYVLNDRKGRGAFGQISLRATASTRNQPLARQNHECLFRVDGSRTLAVPASQPKSDRNAISCSTVDSSDRAEYRWSPLQRIRRLLDCRALVITEHW